MSEKATRLLMVGVLLLGSSPGLQAQENPAGVSLQAFGNVTVNGKAAGSGWSTIFVGDKIVTGAGSAVILLGAEQLQIATNTTVTLGEKAVDLGCGSASLSGGQGPVETLRAAGVEVGRGAAGGKVEVSQMGGNLYVHAIAGTAYIMQGGQKTLVREGATTTLPGATTCPVPVSNAKPPSSSARSLRAPILIVAGAGGAAALIFATSNNQGSLSPADPSKP